MISTALGPVVHSGILLPETVVHSGWFAVLAAFVAINTVIYASLALANVLPKIYVGDWVTSSNRRGETRSIHPGTGESTQLPSTHPVPVPDQR